jgi:cysteine desulfurase/selenocysteine lyase
MEQARMEQALVPRADFLGLEDGTHLYTAAEGPALVRVAAALQEYAVQKSRAEAGRAVHLAVTRDCKEALGRLLGVDGADVALLPSASAGINQVCGAIDFRAGDNVVINDLEFPSVALPWLRLRRQGVELRVVRHRDWDIATGALLEAVDARTRIVALSHVSFVSGLRHDVVALAAGIRRHGALFLLDATQSLGVLPVPAAEADFVVSSTYKWLLGTHGLGVLYWNRARRPDFEPATVGWFSVDDLHAADRFERYALKADAGRFETGYPSFPSIYALGRSVPYLLAAGPERVAAHALALGQRLIDGLTRLGLEVMTPRPAERRGASISFAHEAAPLLGAGLAELGIRVWAGDGRVRASTHLFNDGADVERYLEAVAGLIAA